MATSLICGTYKKEKGEGCAFEIESRMRWLKKLTCYDI